MSGTWAPDQAAPPAPTRPPAPPLPPIQSPSQAQALAQAQAQAQAQAAQSPAQALSRTPILPVDPIQHPSQAQSLTRTPILPLDPLDALQSAGLSAPIQAPARPRQPPARPAEPYPDEEESSDAEPFTVSTMVVPSAFVNAGAYSQGWNGPGQSAASPFAGLPGFGDGPDRTAQEEQPAQVKVVMLASPGSRLLAKIIDLFLAVLMSSPATATLLLVAHRHDHQYVEALRLKATTTYTTLGMDGTGIALWALAAAILILVALLYEAFRVGAGGQTTGRRLVGIRVVRAGSGERFGTGSALVRGLLFWLFLFVPVIDVLALGPVAWGRPYRQGLHDKITRAVTVKTG